MILRDRQKAFVERSVTALRNRGNALGVAPTGAGKSIMLAAVVGRLGCARSCILAHRDEITAQNMDKFRMVNPDVPVSVVDSREKSWSGKAVFAMAQTWHATTTLNSCPRWTCLLLMRHITPARKVICEL